MDNKKSTGQTNPMEDPAKENEIPFLPMGSICNTTLKFTHVVTGESITSQPRPVVVLRDHGNGKVLIATITSRIEKRHVEELGHILEDSLEYGLHKKSAILCTSFNRGIVAREKLSEPIGKIPYQELKKVFEKAEILNKRTHHLHMKLESDFER